MILAESALTHKEAPCLLQIKGLLSTVFKTAVFWQRGPSTSFFKPEGGRFIS